MRLRPRLRALRPPLRARPRRPVPGLRARGCPRDRVRSRASAPYADGARAALAPARRLALRGAAAARPRRPPPAPRPRLDPDRRHAAPGGVGRRAPPARQGRGAQPDGVVQGQGQRGRGGPGSVTPGEGRGLRLDRQCRHVPCRGRCERRPALRDLRAGLGARAQARAAARLRCPGRARAWQLRRDLGAVPAGLRPLRLVQPQRRREPLARRGQEDRGPRDGGAVRRRAARLGRGVGRRRLHDRGDRQGARRDAGARLRLARPEAARRAGGRRAPARGRVSSRPRPRARARPRRSPTASASATRATGARPSRACATRAAASSP